MKRLFTVFTALFFTFTLSLPCLSLEVDVLTKQGAMQRRINEIGFKILNENKIPYRIVFYYVPESKKIVNACSLYGNKSIQIYQGLLAYVDTDDELAAVLGHEISHSVDYNQGLLHGYFNNIATLFTIRKHEYKADKRSIDYMVKAGYNPIALIIMFNKMMGQERFDWFSTHPLSSRRIMNVYEYIYQKYPEYLINNPYKNNIYYQNFLITSKENRKLLKEKIESNSKGKVHYQ